MYWKWEVGSGNVDSDVGGGIVSKKKFEVRSERLDS